MIERRIFTVLLDDPDDPDALADEYRVEVRGVDQLRAELEGKRIGVHIKDAMHTTYLWSWAASIREGKIEPKTDFREFMRRCVQVEGDEKSEPVDPTQQGVGVELPSLSSGLTQEPPSTTG